MTIPPAPGWWLASDGNWYSPATHPGWFPTEEPEPEVAPVEVIPTVPEPAQREKRPKTVMVRSALILILWIGASVGVYVGAPVAAGIPFILGNGHASIVIGPVAIASPTTPASTDASAKKFNGTVDGLKVTGTISPPGVSGTSTHSPTPIAVGTVAGTAGPDHFSFSVALRHASVLLTPTAARSGKLSSDPTRAPEFVVTGTLATQPVHVTASLAGRRILTKASSINFVGTIGQDHLLVKITVRSHASADGARPYSATFTLTS